MLLELSSNDNVLVHKDMSVNPFFPLIYLVTISQHNEISGKGIIT